VHIKTGSGIRIIPNTKLADSSFLNLTRNDSPFELSTIVKFATDDPPHVVIDVCTSVAADLPAAAPGTSASVTPMPKAQYEVEIPITSPSENASSIRAFRTRLWYAARRADLHLDGDLTDPFNTPENIAKAVRGVAPALYLGPGDLDVVAAQVHLERYGAGEVVQRAFVVPDGMRYIISGTATLGTPTADGGELTFAVLDHDDVLGLSALTRQGVAARIVATTDLAVLFIPTAVLDTLVKTRPRLARDIGQEMDNRLGLARTALAAAGVAPPGGSRLIA
jgi:small-conductance mechanosensitive channel